MLAKYAKFSLNNLLLFTGLIIGINVFSGYFLKNLCLDFSEYKLYSISKPSKQILAALTEPVKLRLYISRKLAHTYPYLLNYASRVEELLKNYQYNNPKKIQLEIIELGQFSGLETQAVQDGALGIPVDGTSEELFFGLIAQNKEQKEIIPFIEPSKEATLEKSISNLIYTVAKLDPTKYAGLIDQITPRAEYSRPFTKLAEMQMFTQAKYQIRADALNQKMQQLNHKLTEINNQPQFAKEEEIIKLELTVTRLELVELKKELAAKSLEVERKIKLITISAVPGLILFFIGITWFYQVRIANKHTSAWVKILRQY